MRPGARTAAVPPATGRAALVPVSGKPVLKRALDLALASVMLLASTPVVILVALAIRLEDGGPVLYAQERWGRGGRIFRAFKFRTMVNGADRDGIVQAKEGDSRITRVGHILRATGLDELPQLINIVRGDMSFVGPRALAVGEVVQEGGRHVEYEEIPGFAERLSVRPGLTGLATIHLPRDAPPRLKFAKDVEYVRRRSLLREKIRATPFPDPGVRGIPSRPAVSGRWARRASWRPRSHESRCGSDGWRSA